MIYATPCDCTHVVECKAVESIVHALGVESQQESPCPVVAPFPL